MYKLLILNIAFVIFPSCTEDKNAHFNSYQSLDDANLTQWIEHKIDSVLKKNNIPAISVGIIKDGKVLLSKGFGLQARNSSKPVDENSIYQIASDTKKMTGIIAKNLVLKGQLDLDLPITKYIGNSLEDSARTTLQNITLRHILLHKSGLPYRELTMKRKDGDPMRIPYTQQDLLNDLNKVKLTSKPGTQFSYSNFGYAVAGYICEQASGKQYSALIQEYISVVYNMPNTCIHLTDKQRPSLVTPYRKDDRTIKTQPSIMGQLSSAGGVYSTISDLSTFMLYQMNAYIDYHKNKSYKSPLVLHENLDDTDDVYGFGLGKKVFEHGTQYGHGGDLDGFGSVYLFSPEYQSGVILLTSSGGRWMGELEKELFYKLTHRKYTQPKKSIAQEMQQLLLDTPLEEAKKWLQEHYNSDKYYLSEDEMNNLGYNFLQQNKLNEALKIFQLNVAMFPKSANVYDSLGEAYLTAGNKELAVKNYEQSVKLNPQNEHAIEILKKLKPK